MISVDGRKQHFLRFDSFSICCSNNSRLCISESHRGESRHRSRGVQLVANRRKWLIFHFLCDGLYGTGVN